MRRHCDHILRKKISYKIAMKISNNNNNNNNNNNTLFKLSHIGSCGNDAYLTFLRRHFHAIPNFAHKVTIGRIF